MLTFSKSFYYEWVLKFVKCFFSASIEMIMRFLSFLLFMRYITLIDLYTLNCPYELGMKPIWPRWTIFFMCCWIQFGILLRIFMSIFSKDIGFNFIFFWWWLCWYLASGWWYLHRMPFRVFYPLQLFGRVWEGTGISSLYVWVKLTCEAIWSGIFVCRKFTNYKLYFESSDWSVLIIYMILLDLIVWAEVFENLACFF